MKRLRPVLIQLLLAGLCQSSLHPRALVSGGACQHARTGGGWAALMLSGEDRNCVVVRLRGGEGAAGSEEGAEQGEGRIQVGSQVVVLHVPTEKIKLQEHAGKVGVVVGEESCENAAECADGGRRCTWRVQFDNETTACLHRMQSPGRTKLTLYDHNTPEHLSQRGLTLMRMHGDADQARALFERALEIDPQHSRSMSSFAHFLHSRDRDLDQAHELFTRALEIDPDSAETHCYLGGLYLDDACKKYDKAEKHFQRCLQIDPQHVNALAFYGLLKQEVTKDYNAAERMMSQALMLEPRHPEALSHFATFLGKVHQDYTNAEKMYDMVLELDPKHVNTLCNKGLIVQATCANYSLAEQYYQRAVEVEPMHGPSYGFIAVLQHSIQQKYAAAEENYKVAMKFIPNDPTVLANYGHLLYDAKQDKPGAEAMFKKALQLDANHSTALCNYAMLLEEGYQDYETAAKMYERAIEAEPKHVTAICQYANMLAGTLHQYDKGEIVVRRGLLEDPNNQELFHCLMNIRDYRKMVSTQKLRPHQIAARQELERRRQAKVQASREERKLLDARDDKATNMTLESEVARADKMAELLLAEDTHNGERGSKGIRQAGVVSDRSKSTRTRTKSTSPRTRSSKSAPGHVREEIEKKGRERQAINLH